MKVLGVLPAIRKFRGDAVRPGGGKFELTNGFSKKVENHAAAVTLHYIHYNFARIHKTLRMTPAMAAGIADHIWSYEEIADLAK